jgi:hypothetical protein
MQVFIHDPNTSADTENWFEVFITNPNNLKDFVEQLELLGRRITHEPTGKFFYNAESIAQFLQTLADCGLNEDAYLENQSNLF